MTRRIAALAALLSLASGAALAQPTPRVEPHAGAIGPAGTPMRSAVNEDALKKAQAAQDARSKAWDAKLKKTMQGVCKGC